MFVCTPDCLQTVTDHDTNNRTRRHGHQVPIAGWHLTIKPLETCLRAAGCSGLELTPDAVYRSGDYNASLMPSDVTLHITWLLTGFRVADHELAFLRRQASMVPALTTEVKQLK